MRLNVLVSRLLSIPVAIRHEPRPRPPPALPLRVRALLGSATAPTGKTPLFCPLASPNTARRRLAAALSANLDQLSVYPTTLVPALREAIAPGAAAASVCRPACSTRRTCNCRSTARVRRCSPLPRRWCSVMLTAWWSAPIRSTNLRSAALLAGAQPHYLPCLAEHGFNPDFDAVSG